jgi:hypothetical protein
MKLIHKHFILNSSGSSQVDYSPLYTYYDHLFIPDDTDSVYSDTGRTTLATDGDAVKSLTDLVGSQNMTWISSSTRRSFLDIKHGSAYELTYPLYKKPSGQKAHVSFFNILDSQFQSGTFSALSSPNTSVFVIRSRRAVGDEGGVTLGVGLRDRSQDHFEIINNAGAVELDAASGVANYDQLAILFAVDNGTSSTVYLNNSALGTVKTLSASSITQLLYGSNSHIWEHDLLLAGVINDVLTTGERNTLYSELTGFYTVDERPQAPHAYDVVVTFNGTDTFTCTSSFYDPNGLSENTSLAEYEWFIICARSPVDFAFGESSLESQLDYQRIVYTKGNTLVRSDNPAIWQGGLGGASTPGGGDVWVACRKKSYNTNSQSWSGIPFRSLYVNDNVAGSFSNGKPFFSDLYIKDGFTDRIYVAVSNNGAEDLTGANKTDFVVYVDGAEVTISSLSTTNLNSSFGSDPYSLIIMLSGVTLTYASVIIVKYLGNTIYASGSSYYIREFYTNPFLPVDNQIVGPDRILINFTGGSTATESSPWNNVDSAYTSTGTLIADAINDQTDATGVAVVLTDASTGYGQASSTETPPSPFTDTTTARGIVSNGYVGDKNWLLTFSGFNASESITVKLLTFLNNDASAGKGTLQIIGASTESILNIDSLDPVVSELTFDVDGSGEFTLEGESATNEYMSFCAMEIQRTEI